MMAHKAKHGQADFERSQHVGDKLQLHLMLLDEKYRCHVLYKQIEAFEDKVYLCEEIFNVDVMHKMYMDLARRSGIPRKMISVIKLKQTYLIEQRKVRKRNYSEDETLKYFAWFFDYLTYLQELRTNFVNRIFNPLFKYFYESDSTTNDRENQSFSGSIISLSDFTSSSARTLGTNLSDMTLKTNISRLSGKRGYSFNESVSTEEGGQDDVQKTRQRMMSRAALLILSHEFHDIKFLYDSFEIKTVAQRLSQLKEQVDCLIDTETPIEVELLSPDSGKYVFHLNIRDRNVENLIRFLPDLIVKFQKMAWLSKRWLTVDDAKTKDVHKRLNKLASLEKQLNRKVSILTYDIYCHEEQLEKEANDLMELLKREERGDDLGMTLFNIQTKMTKLEQKLQALSGVNHQLTTHLVNAMEQKDEENAKRLKILQERNKLQRYAVDRRIATLTYHKALLESDMQLELEVKPNLIHLTNDAQDRCEELELTLEKKRKEKRTIQAALIPIKEDKDVLTQRLQQMEQMKTAENTHSAQQADTAPHIDFFITALPPSPAEDMRTTSSQKESPDKTIRQMKGTYPVQYDRIRSISFLDPWQL